MSSKRPQKSWIILFGGIAVILVTVALAYLLFDDKPTRDKWAKIEVGMTEARVVELLGTPRMSLTTSVELQDQYDMGWVCTRQSVTGRVLVYAESMLMLYIWLDADGQVEETCVASS